jgi:cytochrome c553
MWGAAERLSPATAHALAVYFATLTAEPASDGDERLAAAGERIYRDGIPDSNLPSCVPCHGLAAEGLGGIPRLGGQSYNYLKRKLDQWGRGYDAATPPPMPEIAGKLSEREIEALASYLSLIGNKRQATR